MLHMNGSKKFEEASMKMKNLCKKAAGENVESMSNDELELYQTLMQTIDAVNEVIADQNEALQNIDRKLNELNNLLLERGRV